MPALAVSNTGSPDCTNDCWEATLFTPPSGTAGVHLTFPYLPMQTGGSSLTADYHVSNQVYAVFPGSNNYIDAGVSDAFVPPNGWNNKQPNGTCPKYGGATQECISYSYDSAAASQSPGCAASGCGAYFLLWGDHNQVGGVDYNYFHVVRFVSPSFSPPTEYVDILWNYHNDGQWALNFTGDVTASDESGLDDAYHTVAQVEAGLDVSAPSGASDCATFNRSAVGDWKYNGSWNITWPSTPAWSGNNNGPGLAYSGTSNGTGQYTFQFNTGSYGC